MALTSIEEIDKIIDSLTNEQRKIFTHLTDGTYVMPLQYIADECDLPRSYVHRHVKYFYKRHWVKYATLYREDSNHVVGSGYFLTGLGLEIQFRIRAQLPPPTLPEGWGL